MRTLTGVVFVLPSFSDGDGPRQPLRALRTVALDSRGVLRNRSRRHRDYRAECLQTRSLDVKEGFAALGPVRSTRSHDSVEGIRNRLALPAVRDRFDVYQGTPTFESDTLCSARVPALENLFTGALGPATAATFGSLFLFFLKAGAFVFGSGLAIVPFLYGGVVGKFHWLTERQFLDAIAVAMITPGPVVITAAFIGYLVAGALGAALAALAVFAPPYVIVILGAPYYRRFAQNLQVKAFVQGITAAAVGAITGAAFIFGRRSLVDLPTVAIAVLTFGLLSIKKISEPMLIMCAGIAGLLLSRG